MDFCSKFEANEKPVLMSTYNMLFYGELEKIISELLLKPNTSVLVAKWSALPTIDHEVQGSNSAGGRIQLMTGLLFIEQSLSLSPFHCLNMT